MTFYNDYLVLLSPPTAIKNEIDRYKRATARLIGDYKSRYSPAHISVDTMPRQKPFYIEPVIDRLEYKIARMPPVLLHLDGFAFFEHLHGKMTVYASLKNTPSTDSWFTLLAKELGIKKAFTPHITIARDITGEQFNLLWPVIRHKKLAEPFWINELTICKRDTFSGPRTWQHFKRYAFKNDMTLGPAVNSGQPQTDLF
ncbi:2'-5' RNA ligase family protein [Mucilaginibacter pallidiroseus]|uniref:2'-5' RNA ligase family protein n=1 Tax=Mucilaginibacter pallidiroseus TaxID=2599295 RepID=A0A563UIK4_9SPHI|nr:2'-5' RNA ligase family protein [Mucilaginibacter pallidiroseus]TWR31230.1 2'-5' RNA ligase family protein [Mucilaginibacter pallidiroseus]